MARSFLKSHKSKKKSKASSEQKDTSSTVPQIGTHRSGPPLPGPTKPVPLPVIGGHRRSSGATEQKDGSPKPQIGGHRVKGSSSPGTAPISEMQKWSSAKATGGSGPQAPLIGRGRGLGVSRGSSAPTPTPEDVKDDPGPYNNTGAYGAYNAGTFGLEDEKDSTPYKYGSSEDEKAPYTANYSYGSVDASIFKDDDKDGPYNNEPSTYTQTEDEKAPYTANYSYGSVDAIKIDEDEKDSTPYKYGSSETSSVGQPYKETVIEDDEGFKYATEDDLQAIVEAEDETDHDSEDDDDEVLYQNLEDGPEQKQGETAPEAPRAPASKETPAVRTHRAWLVAKLHQDYEQELKSQRPDLKSAAGKLARDIKIWWDLIDELELVDESEPDELDDALDYAPKDHPVRSLTTLAEALDMARRMHAMYMEKARRQELPVTEEGELGDISARMVTYDDKAAQERSLVLVGGSKLFRNDEKKTPVDTKLSSTFHSGLGAEIFVVGSGNEIHMASHKIGKFHHSSLLGGANVSMAGEMQVTNGKIDWVSNKSGHYAPTVVQFQQFLHHLGKDVPLTFPVLGWGVPNGLTAQQLVDGVDESGQVQDNKSHDYVKTQEMLTAWKELVGKPAMKQVMRDHGWTLDKWNGAWEVEDANKKAVPPQAVRQAMKDAFPDKKPVGEK